MFPSNYALLMDFLFSLYVYFFVALPNLTSPCILSQEHPGGLHEPIQREVSTDPQGGLGIYRSKTYEILLTR